jgi:hypothetical protein
MLCTIYALQTSYINRFLLLFADEWTKDLSYLADLIIKYYFDGSIRRNGIEVFEKHNEMIKEIAFTEKREFLEFRLGDGWDPLCKFLGKDVPEHDFPRVNDTRSWRRDYGLDWISNWKITGGCLSIFTLSSVLF